MMRWRMWTRRRRGGRRRQGHRRRDGARRNIRGPGGGARRSYHIRGMSFVSLVFARLACFSLSFSCYPSRRIQPPAGNTPCVERMEKGKRRSGFISCQKVFLFFLIFLIKKHFCPFLVLKKKKGIKYTVPFRKVSGTRIKPGAAGAVQGLTRLRVSSVRLNGLKQFYATFCSLVPTFWIYKVPITS